MRVLFTSASSLCVFTCMNLHNEYLSAASLRNGHISLICFVHMNHCLLSELLWLLWCRIFEKLLWLTFVWNSFRLLYSPFYEMRYDSRKRFQPEARASAAPLLATFWTKSDIDRKVWSHLEHLQINSISDVYYLMCMNYPLFGSGERARDSFYCVWCVRI